MPEPKNMKTAEVAEALNISTKKACEMINAKAFPNAFKLNEAAGGRNEWRVPADDLEAYIKRRASASFA